MQVHLSALLVRCALSPPPLTPYFDRASEQLRRVVLSQPDGSIANDSKGHVLVHRANHHIGIWREGEHHAFRQSTSRRMTNDHPFDQERCASVGQ